MKEIPFDDGGALLAESPAYVEREADHQAIRHLQRMEYITLVEPRQQGKTSLINRLMGLMTPQGYAFAYADLTSFDRTSEATWYDSLCSWLLRQTQFIAATDRPGLPTNGNTWRNFLCDLSEAAQKARLNLVLALDEVGATPDAWATDFFSAIRSVYNSRQSMPCFRYLTFIVAGAFNPKELIRDRTISNFNVDHRVPLDDFTLDQVGQLVHHLELGDGESFVAERLHYWAGGQPFITQRLCRYLAEQDALIVPGSVDAAVEQFFREDTNHLSRILSDLHAEPELLDYARNAIARRIKFSPSVNDWQFRLSHVIGVIAPDQDGRCRIRNRIYEQALQLGEHPDKHERSDPSSGRTKETAGAAGSQALTETGPTTTTSPAAPAPRERSRSTGRFNLERGLQVMKDALRGGDQDAFLEFSTLEGRLLENIRSERLYGSTQEVRSERARVVQELNRLALAQVNRDFNELCTS